MTTPHDAALADAIQEHKSHMNESFDITEATACVVKAYLRSLCADARVVADIAYALREDFKRQWDGHPIPGVPDAADSWTAQSGTVECSELAKAALSALCEMGGAR